MLDTIDSTTELPLDTSTAGKRERIEQELRANPQRSDREIARVVGCDHKTVGAARERMGIATPLGNSPQPPTPTERRHMLIAGAEDFNRLYPPGPSEPATAEEQVDEAIAKGVVTLAPGKIPPPPGVVDEPKYDPFDPEHGDLILPEQPPTAVYVNVAGAVVIRQLRDDDDVLVLVRPEHIEKLVAALRKAAEEAGL